MASTRASLFPALGARLAPSLSRRPEDRSCRCPAPSSSIIHDNRFFCTAFNGGSSADEMVRSCSCHARGRPNGQERKRRRFCMPAKVARPWSPWETQSDTAALLPRCKNRPPQGSSADPLTTTSSRELAGELLKTIYSLDSNSAVSCSAARFGRTTGRMFRKPALHSWLLPIAAFIVNGAKGRAQSRRRPLAAPTN